MPRRRKTQEGNRRVDEVNNLPKRAISRQWIIPRRYGADVRAVALKAMGGSGV